MVTVNIARHDLKAAGWCNDPNRLGPRCTELKLHPVVRNRNVVSPSPNFN
jgi:hypothetical protein